MHKTPSPILVTDFDGTMTKYDFFDLARAHLPSATTHDYWQDYLDGNLTHFEVLSAILAAIRTDREGMEDILNRMELDPDLPDAIQRLHQAGWKIIVASAGCNWYIQRLLDQADIHLEVHANPGVFAPETGLQLSLPLDSPYYCNETGIDKSAIVREAIQRDPHAVFAGDGRPDLAPSQQVQPSRRFARGWLAEHLKKLEEPFHPFETWAQIADRLLEKS